MNLETKEGYYDLCVNVCNNQLQDLHTILSRLHKLGFSTVAINTTVDESVFGTAKKKKKKADDGSLLQNCIPDPIDVENLKTEFGRKLQILSRITFTCSDPAKTHFLAHSMTLKKYNLYAIAPTTQNALQFACAQLNVDIITLRSDTTGLKLNKKLYERAIERGVHFEIQYTDVLKPDTRKLAIHYSHLFYTYGKSKNVVMSSGANKVETIRNPYDLINLFQLLGLSEVKARASILQQCKILLLQAERRRRGKAAFRIISRINTSNTCATPRTDI